jgi:hypothetical protein
LDIQDGHIGFVFLDERLGFLAIPRFGDDLKIARAFEQLTHTCPNNMVIVSQKNADFGF